MILTSRTTRRQLFTAAGSLLAASQFPNLANSAESESGLGLGSGVRLQPLPTRVFKTVDPGGERTESWTIWLIVETGTPRELAVHTVTSQLLSGNSVVRSTRYDEVGVRALTIVPPFLPRLPDGRLSPFPVYWPLAIRVRTSEALAAKTDTMHIHLALREANAEVRADVVLPVTYYEQKTPLIFPFSGKGIITNASVTNGGHRNRSGQFAVDGVGLDERYGVYVSGSGRKSADFAGWGRALLAPAAGVVVHARVDRPDQPDPERSDPRFFAPEYPNGGDPGNHIVIDHGNGEFSMLAHMQARSVAAGVGDRVQQGQVLGKLGSSGDTVTPHVHYQLQAGPDPDWADGLPCTFSNIDAKTLVRGTYFDA